MWDDLIRTLSGTRFGTIRLDEKCLRRIRMLTGATVLLLAIMLIKPEGNGRYVVDQNGHVAALLRDPHHDTGQYELIARVSGDYGSFEKEVTILQDSSDPDQNEPDQTLGTADQTAEADLNMLVGMLENTNGRRIRLPSRLEDGSRITWVRKEHADHDWLMIPVMYVIILVLLVQDEREKERKRDKWERKEILRALPRFTNQLLLMMNSGMILSDALERICASYEMIPDNRGQLLERNLIEMMNSSRNRNSSTAALFTEMAGRYTVKELMRIAVVLRENERRGSDIIENLERESTYLWDNRKVVARERGKMIDTKMTYPLGLLLIILILITMAPAMMVM